MKQETLPRSWSAADSANSSLQRFLGACQVIARSRLALIGVVIVGVWLLTALFAPFMATHDPYEINIAQRLKSPSADHWLGTDYLGRDSYSRIVFGARTAFQVAVGAVFLGAFFGIPIGAIAGFAGRWVDSALMRVMDAIIAFPGRLLAIALVASLGGGLYSLYIALGINSIPSYARIVRGVVMSQKQKEYVEAARMTGESNWSILFLQVLPNCLSPLLVRAQSRLRPRDLGRVVIEFSRSRPAAADGKLGIDVERGHAFSSTPTDGGVLSGADDLADYFGFQLARRRPARRFRPAAV